MHKNQHNPKNTFWRIKRNTSNLSNRQLSDIIGLSGANNVCSYLSGALMPTPKQIQNFCVLFDVDYNLGREEFIKARKNWLDEHPDYKKSQILIIKSPQIPIQQEFVLDFGEIYFSKIIAT